jgi:ligand-binding SRPBCC domain-containing protein
MPTIIIETLIDAPVKCCFDLARNIDLHCQTTSKTKERAVAGVTSGLIEAGQSVTFEAVHFGVRQRLTSQIVEFERPRLFVDEMTKGVFASMRHVHEFEMRDKSTLMRDTVTWKSPLGILGVIADVLFLKRYMTKFIIERGLALKQVAENAAEV